MLVCENHRDKAWPEECDCGPGMEWPPLTWRRDEQACAYIRSDGHSVTDQALANIDPGAASLAREVLDKACADG